jgi:DNA-directed RNA polymerase subunit RPC12/RpoP
MTKLVPDARCTGCNGRLVPPALVSWFKSVAGTDYVCMNCGRPYRWIGTPPKLTTLSVVLNEAIEIDEGDVE